MDHYTRLSHEEDVDVRNTSEFEEYVKRPIQCRIAHMSFSRNCLHIIHLRILLLLLYLYVQSFAFFQDPLWLELILEDLENTNLEIPPECMEVALGLINIYRIGSNRSRKQIQGEVKADGLQMDFGSSPQPNPVPVLKVKSLPINFRISLMRKCLILDTFS